MIKKTFVSLFFVADQLEILKLSSGKKKVEVFATIDLPKGLIEGHEVKNTSELAEILKKIWSKLHIHEKSVGIVVPEFSTFTKVLTLPKIDATELDEAARWQSQEFMPIPLDEMVLDWKIIGEKAAEYQVLVVAIKQSVLAGYVNATAQAGLFPLVVETPSISLARIANSEVAKVIIYALANEIILTLTIGEKVLSSTVVSYEESSQVISLISRMIRYNKDVKVEKIYVGGVGIQTEFLREFCEKNQITVERIALKMGRFSDEDLQRYLIPISLQFKDPAEPLSSTTINLLPEPVVKKYERKRFSLQLWSLLMIVTFMVVIAFVASLGTYIFFVQQISSKRTANVLTNTYTKNRDATIQIKNINDTSSRVLAILAISQQPAGIFNIITESKPEGITIDSYRIDYEKASVTISGLSATRDDLIAFKQSLEKTGLFGQILLPLTAFEIENDLEFTLTFSYSLTAK